MGSVELFYIGIVLLFYFDSLLFIIKVHVTPSGSALVFV